MNKMPEFYMIFAPKYLSPEFWRAIPGSKAESERTRPQHQLRDHGGHHSKGAFVLYSMFMRLLTLLYSISLDAYACDAVTKNANLAI